MPKKNLPKGAPKAVSFSTTLTEPTKALLERFCHQRGMRMNHFVERAILEALEDEMDREIIDARELEDTVEWKGHG